MHEFDYTGKPRSGLFFVAAVEECTNVTSFCELEPAKKNGRSYDSFLL